MTYNERKISLHPHHLVFEVKDGRCTNHRLIWHSRFGNRGDMHMVKNEYTLSHENFTGFAELMLNADNTEVRYHIDQYAKNTKPTKAFRK